MLLWRSHERECIEASLVRFGLKATSASTFKGADSQSACFLGGVELGCTNALQEAFHTVLDLSPLARESG